MRDYHDLTRIDSHFAFGKNWAAYAKTISEAQIDESIRALSKLLGDVSLDGRRFLDIGCGSGLHSLAALRLGAGEVVATDIDVDSITTTKEILGLHAKGLSFSTKHESVFSLNATDLGHFDVVYSWGVLHHTGDLLRAMKCAVSLVKPGGLFVFALYRRIWMDWFWKVEKRWYSKASPRFQFVSRSLYSRLFGMGLLMRGRRMRDYATAYHSNRGMSFEHDAHDWLGGYPYESISPAEVQRLMDSLGFSKVRTFARKGALLGRDIGVFGSGCDEYVYARE